MQQVGEYHRLVVKPVSGAIGAELEGVDLARLDDETFAEIRRAFSDHLALFFHDQSLTPGQYEAFGQRFGDLSITYYVDPIEGSQFVHRFVREADFKWEDRNFGDNWHADQSIRERPNAISALYAIDCPPYGGDTMFTNLYLAYETLSPGMRALCESLTMMHSSSGLYGREGLGGMGVKKPMPVSKFNITPEQMRSQLAAETPHPLVIRDPVTGRKSLYVTGPYCIRFKDMTEEESLPLITFLHQHAVRPEHTCRFRWTEGDVAVFDNRHAQHFAIQDYPGHRREMLRFEVEGGEVIAARDERRPARAAAE
jgi:taurine dioxygenase